MGYRRLFETSLAAHPGRGDQSRGLGAEEAVSQLRLGRDAGDPAYHQTSHRQNRYDDRNQSEKLHG